jgi:hypothetical protein
MLEAVIGSTTGEDAKTLYAVLVGKTHGKRQPERRRNGKMIHKNISETGYEKGTWMDLVKDFFQWRALVSAVLC